MEQANLVTQKDAQSGAYEPNQYWDSKINDLTNEERVYLKDALRAFSLDFDGLIVDLKDKYLNVRSKDKPDGLFRMEVTTPVIYLLRSAAQHCADVDELVNVCIQVFWTTLGPALEKTQEFLSIEIKNRVALIFERLRARLMAEVGHSNNFAEISTAIGDASSKVQSELDRMVGWLQRPESQETPIKFTLRQAFDIAVESAVSGFRPFAPVIHSTITSEVNVHANDLIAISDVVRVALGNVHEHAKTKVQPNIWLTTAIDEGFQMLTINFKSDIGRGVHDEESEGSWLSFVLRSPKGSLRKRFDPRVARAY